jgi:hypothetical protein
MENVAEQKGIKYWVRESLFLALFLPFMLWVQPYANQQLKGYFSEQFQFLTTILTMIAFIYFYFLLKMLDFPFFQQKSKITMKKFTELNLFIFVIAFVFGLFIYLTTFIPQSVSDMFWVICLILMILVVIGYCFHLVQKSIEKSNNC